MIVQPVKKDAEVVNPEDLRGPPPAGADFAAANGLVDQLLHEGQVPELQCLGGGTEHSQLGSRLERVHERGADEPLMRREVVELRVDEREQLFVERRLAEARIASDRRHRLIDFLFQKVQRDVFLGGEVVEDRTLGHARAPGDGFRRRGVESLRLEQGERAGDDASLGGLFVQLAPAARRAAGGRGRSTGSSRHQLCPER